MRKQHLTKTRAVKQKAVCACLAAWLRWLALGHGEGAVTRIEGSSVGHRLRQIVASFSGARCNVCPHFLREANCQVLERLCFGVLDLEHALRF